MNLRSVMVLAWVAVAVLMAQPLLTRPSVAQSSERAMTLYGTSELA